MAAEEATRTAMEAEEASKKPRYQSSDGGE